MNDPLPANCVGCGKRFECGAKCGKCWCMELPAGLPVPVVDEGAGCFCRECLAAKIAGEALVKIDASGS